MILSSFVAATVLMTLGWWGVRRGIFPLGCVDLLWAVCIWLTAVMAFASGSHSLPAFLLLAMVTIWALRLGILLVSRFRSGREDRRYASLRTHWGGEIGWRFWSMFQVQGIFAVLLVWLLAPAFFAPLVLPGLLAGGIGLFGLGFTGTLVADWQLSRFKASGASGLCRQGLWHSARHPNYFFEMLTWAGMGLVTLACADGWPGIISVLLISGSICFLTGVPPKERLAAERYGAAYQTYKAETNRFLSLSLTDPRNGAT